VGHHPGNSCERYQGLRKSRETFGVSEEVSRSDDNVGLQHSELSNPGDCLAVPGSHVDITEMQDTDWLTTGVKNREGFTPDPKVFSLHERSIADGAERQSTQTGEREP
jgi:hypothetical protein